MVPFARLRRFAIPCAALLIAAGSGTPWPAADPLPTVRVATIPIDAGSEVYYAQAQHFFTRAGIDVEIVGLNSGGAVSTAVVAGAADIGQSNAVPVAQAHEHGVPVVFIAPANRYSSAAGQAGIVVALDSPIHTARDFAGKTIGVSGVRGIQEIGTLNWLDKNGGDAASVHFLDLPFPEQAEAIAAHRIDAATMSEPYLSQALNSKRFRVIADPYAAIAPEFLMGGWFATPAWAHDHPQLVAAFSKAILESARWANTHQAQSAQILAAASKSQIGANMHRVPFAEHMRAAELQPLIDVCAKYGLLKASFPAAQIVLE